MRSKKISIKQSQKICVAENSGFFGSTATNTSFQRKKVQFLGHKIKFTNAPLQKSYSRGIFSGFWKFEFIISQSANERIFREKHETNVAVGCCSLTLEREVFFFFFFFFFFGNPTFLKQILGLCFALFCNKWINLSRCSELKKISPALKFRISSRSSSFCYNFPILQSTFWVSLLIRSSHVVLANSQEGRLDSPTDAQRIIWKQLKTFYTESNG